MLERVGLSTRIIFAHAFQDLGEEIVKVWNIERDISKGSKGFLVKKYMYNTEELFINDVLKTGIGITNHKNVIYEQEVESRRKKILKLTNSFQTIPTKLTLQV